MARARGARGEYIPSKFIILISSLIYYFSVFFFRYFAHTSQRRRKQNSTNVIFSIRFAGRWVFQFPFFCAFDSKLRKLHCLRHVSRLVARPLTWLWVDIQSFAFSAQYFSDGAKKS